MMEGVFLKRRVISLSICILLIFTKFVANETLFLNSLNNVKSRLQPIKDEDGPSLKLRGTRATVGWMEERRLTNSSGDSSYPDVARWGDNVHVVWVDNREGQYGIYYKRSINNGLSWDPDFKLSSSGGEPKIAVYENNIHIVWSNNGVWYINSTNNGISFGSKSVFDWTSYPPCSMNDPIYHPDVGVWEDYVYISAYAYVGVPPFNHVIFKRSSDNGNYWIDWVLVAELNTAAITSIEFLGSTIYIVYLWGSGSGQTIEYSYSNNRGDTWSWGGVIKYADTGVGGEFINYHFATSMHGSNLHVVYPIEMANSGVYSNLYGKVTNWITTKWDVYVDVYGDHIVWNELASNNYHQLYSNKYDRIIEFNSHSIRPSIVCNGTIVHLIWMDNRDGNNELYYTQRGLFADLSIIDSDIQSIPQSPIVNNTTITINATVFSYSKSVSNVEVKFYIGNPDANSDGIPDISAIELGNDTINITEESSTVATVQWTPTIGLYEIYVWVDPNNFTQEYNYSNNIGFQIIDVIPGIFTLELYEGWNLISIPLELTKNNLTVVLETIDGKYDSVQWYDSSDTLNHWKHNHKGKPTELNDLHIIEQHHGIWLHITEPGGTSLTIIDEKLTTTQYISIHPGWNLVGFPSLSNKNQTNALNNLTYGNEVDSIWTYNMTTQNWKEISPTDYFEIGRGYWIHANTECEWEVPL